jgi:hypothetical protein
VQGNARYQGIAARPVRMALGDVPQSGKVFMHDGKIVPRHDKGKGDGPRPRYF